MSPGDWIQLAVAILGVLSLISSILYGVMKITRHLTNIENAVNTLRKKSTEHEKVLETHSRRFDDMEDKLDDSALAIQKLTLTICGDS